MLTDRQTDRHTNTAKTYTSSFDGGKNISYRTHRATQPLTYAVRKLEYIGWVGFLFAFHSNYMYGRIFSHFDAIHERDEQTHCMTA